MQNDFTRPEENFWKAKKKQYEILKGYAGGWKRAQSKCSSSTIHVS